MLSCSVLVRDVGRLVVSLVDQLDPGLDPIKVLNSPHETWNWTTSHRPLQCF